MRAKKIDVYSKDLITGEMKLFGTFPISAWIITDEQHNRLTALAREIALANDLTLSVHIEKDSMTIGLYNIAESEEEESE